MMNIQAVKSLIYRRFCLIRKNSAAILLTGFLLVFLGWAILLSMQIGNLKNVYETAEQRKSVAETMAMLLNVAVPIFMATLTSDRIVFSSDIKCKWREYSIATPMRWQENASSSLLLFFSGIGIAFVVSLLNLGIIIAIGGVEFRVTMIYTIFAAFDSVILMSLLTDPFFIRARTEKELMLSEKIVLFMLVVIVIGLVIFRRQFVELVKYFDKVDYTEFTNKIKSWMDEYMYIAVIAFIVLIALKIAINLVCYRKERKL